MKSWRDWKAKLSMSTEYDRKKSIYHASVINHVYLEILRNKENPSGV